MAGTVRNFWWEPDSSEMRGEIVRNLRLREIRQKLKENRNSEKSNLK